jgi:hypothetical protein
MTARADDDVNAAPQAGFIVAEALGCLAPNHCSLSQAPDEKTSPEDLALADAPSIAAMFYEGNTTALRRLPRTRT